MSSVYIMRHGVAEASADCDEARQLTERGAAAVYAGAQGLARGGVRLDRILCSPLCRTRQTADLMAQVSQTACAAESVTWLSPGLSPSVVFDQIKGEVGSILLVTHLPDVASLTSCMVGGQGRASLGFLPGTTAAVDFPGAPQAGGGTLRWFLRVEQLARL